MGQQARELQPLAITISREVGAGGRTVAELLGQRLTAAEKTPAPSPWVVFDANLAKQVLEDHKLVWLLARLLSCKLLGTEDRSLNCGGIDQNERRYEMAASPLQLTVQERDDFFTAHLPHRLTLLRMATAALIL